MPGLRSASGGFGPGGGFVEGTAGQYTWLVPQDPAGLVAALGGRDAALARLDEHLTELNAGPGSPYAFLGNQPGLGTPWLYAWLGRPDRTQAVLRRALRELYAGGLPGNDDLGSLSAWWVLAALGLYPAVPGSDVLTLAAPLFPRVQAGGLRIVRRGSAPFVRALTLDGRPYDRAWLRFADVARGARLRYEMAPAPGAWGTAQLPPSGIPACSDVESGDGHRRQ
jgi:putative alpha-1,2-mannosidase